MGQLNENNEIFSNFLNARFWHKADVHRQTLILSISSVIRYTVIALMLYI